MGMLDACRASNPSLETNSVSYLPTLLGQMDEQGQLPYVYYKWHGHAVRVGDWKLVLTNRNKTVELYNLAKDIGETQNLAAEMPEKLAELAATLVSINGATKKHWGKR